MKYPSILTEKMRREREQVIRELKNDGENFVRKQKRALSDFKKNR